MEKKKYLKTVITVLSLLSAQGAFASHFRWALIEMWFSNKLLRILSNSEVLQNSNCVETLSQVVTKIHLFRQELKKPLLFSIITSIIYCYAVCL